MNTVKFSVIIFLIGCLCNTGFSANSTLPEKPFKKKSVSKTKIANSNKTAKHFISKSRLSQLKAVLVVGPVSRRTEKLIIRAENIATYLRNLGVNVYTFYPPNDNWEDIVQTAHNAHIFYYTGHGTTEGEKGKVGGLCLSDFNIISSSIISQTLKLHKNALVILNSVCYSAGASASDTKDIGKYEAMQRVSDYSHPFIKAGAGAYYANNYGDEIVPFLETFLGGENLKNSYIKHLIYNNKPETISKNPYFNNYLVGISSLEPNKEIGLKQVKNTPSFKSYDIAFAGKPNLTYMDWFR